MDNELYTKFPAVLQKLLIDGTLNFPAGTKFEYEPILVYRAVERKENDKTGININDFRSYYELGKVPKNKTIEEAQKDIDYYSVSSFLDKRIVEQLMHFPNPKKKMAQGYVYKDGGPQNTNIESQHVSWWLYDGVLVEGFQIL